MCQDKCGCTCLWSWHLGSSGRGIMSLCLSYFKFRELWWGSCAHSGVFRPSLPMPADVPFTWLVFLPWLDFEILTLDTGLLFQSCSKQLECSCLQKKTMGSPSRGLLASGEMRVTGRETEGGAHFPKLFCAFSVTLSSHACPVKSLALVLCSGEPRIWGVFEESATVMFPIHLLCHQK